MKVHFNFIQLLLIAYCVPKILTQNGAIDKVTLFVNASDNFSCQIKFHQHLKCIWTIDAKYDAIYIDATGINIENEMPFNCSTNRDQFDLPQQHTWNCTWTRSEKQGITEHSIYNFTLQAYQVASKRYRNISESCTETSLQYLERMLQIDKPDFLHLTPLTALKWAFPNASTLGTKLFTIHNKPYFYQYRIGIFSKDAHLAESFIVQRFRTNLQLFLRPETEYKFTFEMQIIPSLNTASHDNWSPPMGVTVRTQATGDNLLYAPEKFSIESDETVAKLFTIKWKLPAKTPPSAANFYYRLNLIHKETEYSVSRNISVTEHCSLETRYCAYNFFTNNFVHGIAFDFHLHLQVCVYEWSVEFCSNAQNLDVADFLDSNSPVIILLAIAIPTVVIGLIGGVLLRKIRLVQLKNTNFRINVGIENENFSAPNGSSASLHSKEDTEIPEPATNKPEANESGIEMKELGNHAIAGLEDSPYIQMSECYSGSLQEISPKPAELNVTPETLQVNPGYVLFGTKY